jgi:hypothetical protein
MVSIMLSATCHCGEVTIKIRYSPEKLTNCNCPICRRHGALWAYSQVGEVDVIGHPEKTQQYIWGDKTLRIVRSRNCGCVTHWEPLEAKSDGHMGVNAGNFDPIILCNAQIQRFDGADTWKLVE